MIEGPALYPWMSAIETMRVLTAATHEVASSILEQVRLDISKPVRSYSQGMRQRLGIAIAIANGASTVILDEPTNGLDPAGAREFEKIVHDLRDQGRAVLLSSHQITGINRVCDRVVLLNMGRTIGSGTADELGANRPWQLVHPADAETSQALQAVRERYHAETDPARAGFLVDTRDPNGLLRLLQEHGIQAEVGTIDMSLEDRFLMLTSSSS